MKPFWKNTRKKKSKKHSEPSQQKPRIQTRSKPMEEPWKPPMGCSAKGSTDKGNADCSDAGIRSVC